MAFLYIVEDTRDFRIGLVEAFKRFDQKNWLTIKPYGERGEDVEFLWDIKKIASTIDHTRIFVVLDIEMPISWTHWVRQSDDEETKHKKEFKTTEFESHAAHGFNIYNIIREYSRLIKIVILSSHNDSEILRVRDGKPFPHDIHLRRIYRNASDEETVKQINAFFKLY